MPNEEETSANKAEDLAPPKPPSESKKNAELIEAWYQSYYLWNSAYMTNFVLNSHLALNSHGMHSISYLTNPVVV